MKNNSLVVRQSTVLIKKGGINKSQKMRISIHVIDSEHLYKYVGGTIINCGQQLGTDKLHCS